MAKYLMAMDAGTGSVRAVIFSTEGDQVGCVQKEWTHQRGSPMARQHGL